MGHSNDYANPDLEHTEGNELMEEIRRDQRPETRSGKGTIHIVTATPRSPSMYMLMLFQSPR